MKNRSLIVASCILAVCILAFIIVNVVVGNNESSPVASDIVNSSSSSPAADVNDKNSESQQKSGNIESGYSIFDSNENGFMIQYPGDWQQQQNDMRTGVAFLAPSESDSDGYQETITVVVQDLSQQPMTLIQYTNSSVEQIKQAMTNCEVEESGDVTVAGEKGYKMIYSGTAEGLNLKVMSVWTIKNNKAYVFTFSSEEKKYSKYQTYAEKSLKTFGFKE